MKSIGLGLMVAVLQLCMVLTAAAQAPQKPGDGGQEQAWRAFETFHREILSKHCVTCHSAFHSQMSVKPTAAEAARYLLARRYVVAGSLEQSKVYYRLSGGGWFSSSMPPRGFDKDPVKDKQIREAALSLLSAWINAGSPVPN